MIQLSRLLVGSALSLVLVVAPGCGSPAEPPSKPVASSTPAPAHDHDHDHGHGDQGDQGDHDHPETLAEGLAELEKALADVATKLTGDTRDAADHAVHAIGHLLEDLDALVGKQDVADDVKEAGRKAVAELVDCFDTIDQALHAGEGAGETPAAVHASVAERITTAVKSLKGHIKDTSTSQESTR